jgi:hypothetical protein
MSDDLATLRYRTVGKQAPLIIRTRGHRLEFGIQDLLWNDHKRNSRIRSPRNMTQAAGFIIVCSNVMNRLW